MRKIFLKQREGYVVVGVLSKDYPTVEEAVTAMKAYGKEIDDAVSIGLEQEIIAKRQL